MREGYATRTKSGLHVALVLSACASSQPPSHASPAALNVESAEAMKAPVAADAGVAEAAASPSQSSGRPCGPLECTLFATPKDALAVVLAGRPVVLGVGEAHAQKTTAGEGPSTTKRFTDELLPDLATRASELVVELMLPPKGCKKAEQEVRTTQREVTASQVDTNQAEYVHLAEVARKLGLVPDALRPSCRDLEAVAAAGDGAIPRMLETIARLAGQKTVELLARPQTLGLEKMVILYGGALHNDVDPKPERAAWSYGPDLVKATKGRYLELDVFAPEAIQDTTSWRAFPWYPYYDRRALGASAVLFHPAPSSWVLIFPESAP